MIKKLALYFLPFFLFILSACGGQIPTASNTTTASDDPCSTQNLPDTVRGISDLMNEFDDTSAQITGISIQQLPEVISELQRIRRDAEDLQIPPCLATLKTHQLNHMNLMIQALLAFVGGADQQTLSDRLEMARQEHDLYALEIVRLLGITLAPITATASSP
ncbi:MAG TPA: hypothetical protein VK897_17240 [Anaerolineales bacterium]|nr:hypothetical protein [Anaerolineales bacterium]